MNQQIAATAIEFLKRADLKGIEVEAFVTVIRALSEIANPPETAAIQPSIAKEIKTNAKT